MGPMSQLRADPHIEDLQRSPTKDLKLLRQLYHEFAVGPLLNKTLLKTTGPGVTSIIPLDDIWPTYMLFYDGELRVLALRPQGNCDLSVGTVHLQYQAKGREAEGQTWPSECRL